MHTMRRITIGDYPPNTRSRLERCLRPSKMALPVGWGEDRQEVGLEGKRSNFFSDARHDRDEQYLPLRDGS